MYGWVIPQKLSVNDFKWVEETSQFHEDFIKIYDDDRDKGHFIEADILFTWKNKNQTKLKNCGQFTW